MAQFMITNGHGSYIRHDTFSNKYVPVRNRSMGDIWDQRHVAANVLKNSLGKKLKRQYKVIEIDSLQTNPPASKTVSDKRKEQEAFAKAVATREIEKDQSEKWATGVSAIKEILVDSEQRREELAVALSEVDKEISDIHHYIELGKFNAYQGWLAFNMLRNCLQRRRVIKDELRVLSELGSCKITSDMMIDINNAINDLKNRKYAPRVLTGLFE